jgi:pimeloyl-ACP methyl ester carboxylesterase
LKHVNVSGTRLAYVESGRGAPVVLVHGAYSDFRYWSAQLEASSEELRVIAYSRRDFHPNAHDSDLKLQTAERDVADLIELIVALDLPPAHIVGHSAGGNVALIVAARRPELVRSLVLEEGGFVVDHPSSAQALAEVAPVGARAAEHRAAGAHAEAARTFIDFVSGEGFFASVPHEIRQIFIENDPAMGIRPNAQLTCRDAASVESPVLMILGERSPPFIGRLMRGALDCLRNEETVTIPGASHGIHYEQPAAFNRVVFGFIATH